MRTLPKVVANTKVGKSVELKVWRDKKSISKRLILGRLESSEEFKEKKSKTVNKENEIETLKITVRDITSEDITSRNLKNNTKGVIIVSIANSSPLTNLLNVNDIIIEVQKTSVKNSSNLNNLVERFLKKVKKHYC